MAVKIYTQNIKGKTSTDKLLTLLTILLLPTNSSSRIHVLTRPRLRARLRLRLRLRRDISCPERAIRVAEIARGIDDIPDQRFKMFDLFYHISINRSISIYKTVGKEAGSIPGNPPFIFLSQITVSAVAMASSGEDEE